MGISEFTKFAKAKDGTSYTYDKIQDLLPNYHLTDNDSESDSDGDSDDKPDQEPQSSADETPSSDNQKKH